jgi:acyl CoA:acetate/3-ketoacid CoA transferase alpha subunit
MKYFTELLDNRLMNFEELEKKESKIMSLHELIEKHIKNGQLIHFGVCGSYSSSAIQEITRQFHNKNPQFTIFTLGATTQVQYMLGANLDIPMIRKLKTTFAGDAYPRTFSAPIFNHHLKKGMEMEYWSIMAFVSSLLAGAMKVPFLPTNSWLNSSLEEENSDIFQRIKNPFKSAEPLEIEDIGIIKAIHPDVSIFHAWASDPYGNSIFVPPYGEDIYGAFACRGPVLVTTEYIVDTNYIKEYSNYVRLPGHLVTAVAEVRYGAHPSMLNGLNGGYTEDLNYLVNFNKNNRSPEKLYNFVKEWILDTKSIQGYKNKVGIESLLALSGRKTPNSWVEDLKQRIEQVKTLEEQPINTIEFMILNAANIVADRIISKNLDVILAGQGHSNLTAWLSRYIVAKKKGFTNLVAEVGFYGYLPRLGNPIIFNMLNIPTCSRTTNVLDILGFNLCCDRSSAVLGAAQIDKYGNINSSKVGSHHIIGSGGANDCGSPNKASEIFVVCQHRKEQMLDEVPYITVPGDSVSTVITTLGVLEKGDGNKELVLTEYFNLSNRPKDEILEEIKSNTGWDLKISNNLTERKEISSEELAILRLFDPNRFFIRET